MSKNENGAKLDMDSVLEASSRQDELSRAEWAFVFLIIAIIIGKTVITAMGAI